MMGRIRLWMIGLSSFVLVAGTAVWKKALPMFLCLLLSMPSSACFSNSYDNKASAAIPPSPNESIPTSNPIGDIPRIRKPRVKLDLQQTLPADFQVSSQMPFSSGKREILLVSPSTGIKQTYTVNLPGRQFQMYEIAFANIRDIDSSNLSPTSRYLLEDIPTEAINRFQVDFERNKPSEIILANGTRGEFSPGEITIRSPGGEALEILNFSELDFGKDSLITRTQSNREKSKLLANSPNCNDTATSAMERLARRMESQGNQIVVGKNQATKTVGLALSITAGALKNNINSRQSISQVTCEKPVQCNEERANGANEVRSDLFAIPPGINRQVILEYQFFNIEDTIEVNYDGKQVFIDGPKSGLHQKSFTLPDNAEFVGVKVTGNVNPETRWWYVISCSGSATLEKPEI
ncbi:hypothetical protein [Roseofilum casamattae]|uniref:Uncharacterized protein n=1 Tax=Roseofilum casamattae BLCC-M143 TaxID=3022442 RepID=A0ABT7BZ34_9CYAN|nr:hypothetical protein [Roseofilum casamattae]MDJ1184466.1 hypothetical protein [Roseofilum casamattae BLCC-M143]